MRLEEIGSDENLGKQYIDHFDALSATTKQMQATTPSYASCLWWLNQ